MSDNQHFESFFRNTNDNLSKANDFKNQPFKLQSLLGKELTSMGPLQLAVTSWYKIRHAGEQATHWDIQNKENANLS